MSGIISSSSCCCRLGEVDVRNGDESRVAMVIVFLGSPVIELELVLGAGRIQGSVAQGKRSFTDGAEPLQL